MCSKVNFPISPHDGPTTLLGYKYIQGKLENGNIISFRMGIDTDHNGGLVKGFPHSHLVWASRHGSQELIEIMNDAYYQLHEIYMKEKGF